MYYVCVCLTVCDAAAMRDNFRRSLPNLRNIVLYLRYHTIHAGFLTENSQLKAVPQKILEGSFFSNLSDAENLETGVPSFGLQHLCACFYLVCTVAFFLGVGRLYSNRRKISQRAYRKHCEVSESIGGSEPSTNGANWDVDR